MCPLRTGSLEKWFPRVRTPECPIARAAALPPLVVFAHLRWGDGDGRRMPGSRRTR
jgi:hypothetical protein